MEKLYNGIVLEDDFKSAPSDARHVPYLENPPEVINVSVGRQLFIDDFLIEETDLAPEHHKAKKFDGNPILRPEMPWEIDQSPVAAPKSGGVWYDEEEGIFKMWYEAAWLHNMCYATSRDGIRWERPVLDDGVTNKILHYKYSPEVYNSEDFGCLRPDSSTVFIDYDAPKDEKYKLFMRNPGGLYHAILAVSGDGVHFDKFAYTDGMMGDRSTAFYNPFRKKWVYSLRYNVLDGGLDRRRAYHECDDFLNGGLLGENAEHGWLSCDELDLPNPYIGEKPQLYNVDCIGYESIMLGMFQILYGPQNEICSSHGVPKITELETMYSRDGYHFSRPSRESFIGASIYEGAWDRGYVQSVGGGVIVNGDELWIYYVGFGGDPSHAGESWLTNGMYRNGATGLAKLRRDGFVSMNGKGYLTTRPLIFTKKTSLFVNAKGRVYAELYSENGEKLDTSSVFIGDSTSCELKFDVVDIASLNGKVIRIKFYVDGELYSFGFADENGDFDGAHAAGVVK